jgi:hypothetical protein
MATDNDRQAVEATKFRKKLDTAAAKKRYDVAHARALAITALLEEERVAAIFTEETRTAVALIEPPLTHSLPPVGRPADVLPIHLSAEW